MTAAAQKNLPCVIHKANVPRWDDKCKGLFCSYADQENTENRDKAENKVFNSGTFGVTGKDAKTMESIHFTPSIC